MPNPFIPLEQVTYWKLRVVSERDVVCQSGGMPKVNQAIADAVFYLYGVNPKIKKVEGPLGTGFIVSRPSKAAPDYEHYYGVTNRHCLMGGISASQVRLNTLNGKAVPLPFDLLDWTYDVQGDDLAVIDLTDHIDPAVHEVAAIPEEMFATAEFIKDRKIGFGDDTFMVGLFADHHGGERNVPVTRFGNISMLGSDAAKVKLQDRSERAYHLVDTRSRTGFSGSPVYVYRVPTSALDSFDAKDWSIDTDNNLFMRLLGVHCDQFWEDVEIRKKDAPKEDASIAASMTIVVPAWRISAMLDDGDLEKARRDRDARDASKRTKIPRFEARPKRAAQAKAESSKNFPRSGPLSRNEGLEVGLPSVSETPASDNPRHKEDFTNLLRAAAQGRKPARRTSKRGRSDS